MITRLLAILALFVVAPFASAEPLDLTNAKNAEAATVLLARYFENIGLDVIDKDEKQFGLKFGGYNIVLVAYCSDENGCRLNAYITYGGRKENVGNAKLMNLVNDINSQFNLVAFSVDKDGDICYRYSLVFDRKLDAKVIQRWLRQVESQTNAIRAEHREQLKPFMASKPGK